MRIPMMKLILFVLINFILLGAGFSLGVNDNQNDNKKDVVRSFEQLFELWRTEVYSSGNIKLVDTLINNPEELQMTLTNFSRVSLAATLQYHHIFRGIRMYEDSKLIRLTAGKNVNQTSCIEKLEELVERATKLQLDGFNSTDIEVFRLLDTYGQPASGLAYFDTIWPGHYKECLNQNIRLAIEKTKFHYCIGSLKFKNWSQSRMTNYYGYESAVCLPTACDSLDYNRKFKLVEKLIKAITVKHVADEIELTNLYCLPDKLSSYLNWWQKPKTCIFLLIFFIWILAQLYATISQKNERIEKNNDRIWYKIMESMDMRRNFVSLFSSTKTKRDETSVGHSRSINLDTAYGVKVICLILVMMGHFLMITTANVKNAASYNSVAPTNYLFTISNEPPAFLISIFFLLSGIMISYSLFQSKVADFIALSPARWFDLVLKRYIRLIPIYGFMVAYSKYFAKYTGSGPFWDYGTSALSPRKICEQESWWHTLTFTSNFKPIQASCVMAGWYLSSDMQFMALSPIFLTALATHPKTTKILIYIIMLVSCTASGVVNYFNEIPDFTPVYRINLFSNGISIVFMNEIYTRPYYRISAFLVGILVGHYLYECRNAKQDSISGNTGTTGRSWMNLLRRYDKLYSLFVLGNIVLIFNLGIIAKLVPFDGKMPARIAVSILFPVLLSYASVIVGLYIVLASEGRGCRTVNKILSASFWVPLAKMSLTVLVCHCEVIITIVQSVTLPIYLEFFTHLSFIILTLITTYSVSLLLFLLIEAPCGQLLKNLLAAKSSSKK